MSPAVNPAREQKYMCLIDPGRPGAFFFYRLEDHKQTYLYMSVLQNYSGVKELVLKDMHIAGFVLELIHESSRLINYN